MVCLVGIVGDADILHLHLAVVAVEVCCVCLLGGLVCAVVVMASVKAGWSQSDFAIVEVFEAVVVVGVVLLWLNVGCCICWLSLVLLLVHCGIWWL